MSETVIKPGYHEKWYNGYKRKVFLRLLKEWTPVDGDIIEVGCWEGRSTVMLAKKFYPRVVTAVDHFKGGSAPFWKEQGLAEKRDAKKQFLVNVRHYTKGNVRLLESDWRPVFEAYPNIPNMIGKIALAHIDGDHAFEPVYDNIMLTLRHAVPGTLILGDDFDRYPSQAEAVMAALPKAKHDGETWWHTVTAADL